MLGIDPRPASCWWEAIFASWFWPLPGRLYPNVRWRLLFLFGNCLCDRGGERDEFGSKTTFSAAAMIKDVIVSLCVSMWQSISERGKWAGEKRADLRVLQRRYYHLLHENKNRPCVFIYLFLCSLPLQYGAAKHIKRLLVHMHAVTSSGWDVCEPHSYFNI